MVWWDLCARGTWLQPRDAYLLELACRQIVSARRWAAMSEKRGITQVDKDRRNKMERVAPWERMRLREETAANKTLVLLGFTPGSTLGYTPTVDTRSDFDKFLDALPSPLPSSS